MILKSVLFSIALIGGCTYSYAQSTGDLSCNSDSISLYYKINSKQIDESYMSNEWSLNRLKQLFCKDRNGVYPDSLKLIIASSVDGLEGYNKQLAQIRARDINAYIESEFPQYVSRRLRLIDENWDDLDSLIAIDPYYGSNDDIKRIKNLNSSPDARELQLRSYQNGKFWAYLTSELLPRTRYVCFVFYHPALLQNTSVDIQSLPSISIPSPKHHINVSESYNKPLFAIKTNLLYDVVTILNAEIEIPLKNRWSLSGEFLFPWWKSERHDLTMQLLAGQGALKYWFGNRSRCNLLEGWSLGIVGGAGKYDVQLFEKQGEQGHLYNIGLQGGFAHRLGNHLKMEYSIGAGLIHFRYKSYDKVEGTEYGNIKVFRYPWIEKSRNWWGPFSAKVSLVWLINYKSKVRKGSDL